jgi:uncharacterized membrane protein (UPF0127 family)
MRLNYLLLSAMVVLMGCQSDIQTLEEFGVRAVRFPNGKAIQAETMITPEDLARGMMYRDSLPSGRGMLFIHPQPGPVSYWMYNVRIPLDLVFMNPQRRIVHIERNAPPCRVAASDCPRYGPVEAVQFVLELPAGDADRFGLKRGDNVTF